MTGAKTSPRALRVGDTLRARRPCLHWVVPSKQQWLEDQRQRGKRIVAVDLADGAPSLARLQPARESTVLLLGHEHQGVPDEVLESVDECVEIPMVGMGAPASMSPSRAASSPTA